MIRFFCLFSPGVVNSGWSSSSSRRGAAALSGLLLGLGVIWEKKKPLKVFITEKIERLPEDDEGKAQIIEQNVGGHLSIHSEQSKSEMPFQTGRQMTDRPTAHPVTQLVMPQMSIPSPIPSTFMMGMAVTFPEQNS